MLAVACGCGWCLGVCLLHYLCDSAAEPLGQLGDLFLGCLRLLSLLIQLLRLPVVIYLQVLHAQTHAHTHQTDTLIHCRKSDLKGLSAGKHYLLWKDLH